MKRRHVEQASGGSRQRNTSSPESDGNLAQGDSGSDRRMKDASALKEVGSDS
jgi:hypothetical protein